jgi:hypothetical protein
MSKIRHKQKLILPFFGFVLLMCLMGWLNVFGQLMKLSINLPSPSLMTTLGFDQSVPDEHKSSAQLNRIASFPDTDTNVRLKTHSELFSPLQENAPVISPQSFTPPLIASQFLLTIPNLFANVQNNERVLISAMQQADAGDHWREPATSDMSGTDPVNQQFAIPSHYASFFAVTLMQDRLPPVIEAQSSNWAINRERQTSPKPQLRNTDDSRKLYVSIGYFTNQENLKRTLETIEITGYPKQFTQITISGKAGHWVRIGPFNSQEKASKALEITKSMGFSDAYKISG